jgi:hypothetical protein
MIKKILDQLEIASEYRPQVYGVRKERCLWMAFTLPHSLHRSFDSNAKEEHKLYQSYNLMSVNSDKVIVQIPLLEVR